MKKIKVVLFDFDGVLIDSLSVMEKAWEITKNKYYLNSEFKDFSKYIGIPFLSILENLGIDKAKLHLVKKSYAREASKNIKLISLNPYVSNLFSWLSNNHIKIGIVTSKDSIRTAELIEYLNLNVDLVITPELTTKGKPHPEPLLFAVKKLSLNIEDALFVGDMVTDMKAAYSANCKYLHYLCGYQKIKNPQYGGSISSLLEIKEYILGL